MRPSDQHKTEERVRFVARHYQPNRFDSRRAWSEMQEQLGIPPKRRSLTPYWQAAAAVAILLIAGIFYFTGDRTETLVATNHQEEFSLPDQTRIVMQQGAELEYNKQFGESERHVLMHGEIAFAVVRDEFAPFIVTTPTARVEVLGTEFSVHADDNETRLNVTSGRVLFTPNDPVIPLLCGAGMNVHYIADSETVRVTSPGSSMEINGITNTLSFDNVKLKEVVRVLALYYNVSLELPESEADIPFSSSFTAKSIIEIINIINFTLDTGISLSS